MPVKGVEPSVRVMVAVEVPSYKAAIDFVFFGRDKNDNNTERFAFFYRVRRWEANRRVRDSVS
jgi:hypothetical protein